MLLAIITPELHNFIPNSSLVASLNSIIFFKLLFSSITIRPYCLGLLAKNPNTARSAPFFLAVIRLFNELIEIKGQSPYRIITSPAFFSNFFADKIACPVPSCFD